ncbi:MAG: hypothetical protein IPP47_00610 [Bryobacterales bacterium]|nr:hypothetical protein [Bryobacterales bacterium]
MAGWYSFEINAKRGQFTPDSLLALIQGGSMEALRDLRSIASLPLAEVTPLLPIPCRRKSGASA